MSELIYKQAAVDIAKELTITVEGYEMHNQAVTNYCAEIMQLPSAQPERPRGHWIEIGDEPYDEWECDVCGFAIDGSGCIDPEEYRDVYKFCPNCGADMRGEQDG